jgi:hypothetical protein
MANTSAGRYFAFQITNTLAQNRKKGASLRESMAVATKSHGTVTGIYRMSATKLVNFFHCTADNVGDQMCGPAQFLWPQSYQSAPLNQMNIQGLEVAIVGGGQIFSQLGTTVNSIRERNPDARVIAWGVGLPPRGTRDREVTEVVKAFTAFGTRNYDRRDELLFVPCASCLSPLFDQVNSPQHELVVYLHRRKRGPIDVPKGVPVLNNSMQSPKKAIDFIASGDVVVTSSYHGVYWAQLLGRRVVCIPYNSKFRTFQHPPTLAEPDQWLDSLASSRRTEPLLHEYRNLNYMFAVNAIGG